MMGYCQNCKTQVEVTDLVTVRLPNRSFIHKGLCANSKCHGIIFIKIHDQDIIIDEAGHKCPKEVYTGQGTPKRISREAFGQKIFTKEGITDTAPEVGVIKTVYDLKKEQRDEKIK